jgi:GMP synthase-like glutamine amidotransferase
MQRQIGNLMRIGILQTGLAPDGLTDQMGDYPDMFARLLAGNGFTFATFRVVEGAFPASVRDCDGWLITGSRHGVYEDHAFIAPLEQFIRDSFAQRVPVVGVCFGHQIIAQAMGGKVERYAGGWIVGATDYDFEGQNRFQKGPKLWPAMRFVKMRRLCMMTGPLAFKHTQNSARNLLTG